MRRHQDALYRHAVRMLGRPDDAWDVVQESLVRGYRNLEDCRHPDRVGGWLFRILSNLCKDRLRSRHQDDVSLEDAPPVEAGRGDPDRELEKRELSEELEEALESLSPNQREAFLLKHLEGRSYEEMSEMIGASVSALKMRVHRARDELQELLEHYR